MRVTVIAQDRAEVGQRPRLATSGSKVPWLVSLVDPPGHARGDGATEDSHYVSADHGTRFAECEAQRGVVGIPTSVRECAQGSEVRRDNAPVALNNDPRGRDQGS